MKEKILTLHPSGKNGVNISLKKYEQIKAYILDTLKKEDEISYQELDKRCFNDLSETFDGKVSWYLVTVKLDLEARKIIERVPRTSPHKIRLIN